MSIAIAAVASAAGDETRANSWWPSTVVQRWAEGDKVTAEKVASALQSAPEPDRTTLSFFHEDVRDPFRGVLSRPVLGGGQSIDDLNAAAAQAALTRAGLQPSAIDLLVTHDLCPSLQGTNVAPTLHARLCLRADCLAYAMDASANSFLVQLQIARTAIAAGAAKYVLLTQSNVASPLIDYSQNFSGWFGDMATAVVVTKAEPGEGLLALTHRVEGNLQGHLVTGVPGKDWWEDGRSVLHDNPALRDRVFLGLGRFFIDVGRYVLEEARLEPRDVSFLASHQGFRWIAELCKKVLDAPHVRTAVTHERTANVTACNLPVQIETALERGSLKRGDVALLIAGGNGITYSGAVFAWR